MVGDARLNKVALLTVEWLKKQGFNETQIITSSSKPEILCTGNGVKYFPKRLYRDTLVFTKGQKRVLDACEKANIVVFDQFDRFVNTFEWKEWNKQPFKVIIYEFGGFNEQTVPVGVKLNKEVIAEMEKYLGLFKPFQPTKGEVINKSAWLGLRILRAIKENDGRPASDVVRKVVEDIAKEGWL